MGETIIKIIVTLALSAVIIALLPADPIASYIQQWGDFIPYRSYINYFIPFGNIATITSVWLAAIVTYDSVSWIAKQLNIIGGNQ